MLNAAAEKGDWGKPLPAGVHRGIAQFMGYGSYSAATAEVSVSKQGKLKVHRMVLATNCGHAVNPHQIAAQVEGGVAYGLSATLYGEMVIDKGRVTNTNFDSYEILRLAEMPKVETVIVPTYDFWGGVGEPTICVVAPAVMNAIFAATGKPVREPAAEECEAGVGSACFVSLSPCGSEQGGRGVHRLAASHAGPPQLFNTTHAPPALLQPRADLRSQPRASPPECARDRTHACRGCAGACR